MRHLARLAAMPVLAMTLSGCIAAALPAIAGGAILRSGNSGKGETASLQPAPAIEASMPGQLPPPGPGQAGRSEGRAGFTDLVEYARSRASAARHDNEALSALLRNPGQLDGERLACNGLAPAVLIDLDPEGETLGPQVIAAPDPVLASRLEALRAGGISIGWISGANADQAGLIRHALAQAGLDPAASDQLLLMRYPDDRKQTRRDEFAASHCIIAIAGDHLADFDELFLFLKNPDAAQSLQAMIGDGWFITPPALTKQ